MDDQSFSRLLQFFDLSWRGYRRVRRGVKKRIARHMQQLSCHSMDQYLTVLRENSKQRRKARELLTVSISRLFRDQRLWDAIKGPIIDRLIHDRQTAVRVWSAGCACGEEVYSLRILWDMAEDKHSHLPPLHIWATDMNPTVLEKARAGIYTSSSLKEINDSVRDDYFISTGKGKFVVKDRLRKNIHWLYHDLTSEDPPGTDFDLIFLRNNLLTYYEDPIKNPAFMKLVDVLRWGGYLIIGNNEEVPLLNLPLAQCPAYRCIWMKEDSSQGNHKCETTAQGNLY